MLLAIIFSINLINYSNAVEPILIVHGGAGTISQINVKLKRHLRNHDDRKYFLIVSGLCTLMAQY